MTEVKIQCPECGEILKRKYPLISKCWKCPKCKEIYTENEIRERCVL